MRKKSILRLLLCLLSVSIIFISFRSYFSTQIITAPDFPFLFNENFKELISWPFAWAATRMGESVTPYLFTYPPLLIYGFLGSFLSFARAERIVWFFPFLVIGLSSSTYLIRNLFPKNIFWFLAPLVFLLNTYILMIVGGGQMGLALSYALLPLTLIRFIKFLDSPSVSKRNRFRDAFVKDSLVFGMVLALQVMFDPRIAYLTLVIIFLYALFQYFFIEKFRLFSVFFLFLISGFIVLGLHFYWILPSVLGRGISLPQGYGSSDWLGFLSSAQLSNTLTLLHPFWPENIFGKVHFMNPVFLVIPILAYASILFVNQERKEKNLLVLYFAFLGIAGAFLAKGVNPPFGEFFSWSFKHLPGMNMFRDPTKFYLWVALSYSILIPYTVHHVYIWIDGQTETKSRTQRLAIKNYVGAALILLVVAYWLFLVRPAWLEQLSGTFRGKEVPQEYVELKDFLSSQPEFFRTFWVPRKQRFGFYSNNHPALYAQEFVSPDICRPPLCRLADTNRKPPEFDPITTSETDILDQGRNYSLSYFSHPDTPEVLAQMGVKYIIVPYDSEGEIFLRDRKYSEEEREKYITALNGVEWLEKIGQFKRVAVYQTPSHQDHFYVLCEKPPEIKWKMINPTEYEVKIKNASQPFDLIFSETFDPLWQAKINDEIIPSEKRYNIQNSFPVDKKGDFDIVIEFAAQKYVWWGQGVSILTLLASGFLLLRRFKK